MGGYGILRIAFPLCPDGAQYAAYVLVLIGAVSIIYGAFAAMAQTDFKRLVAYSSVSHMGYVILGIAVWKINDERGLAMRLLEHGHERRDVPDDRPTAFPRPACSLWSA